MTENQVRLTIGALLHDVGKVIYRTGDGRNHSASGKDYLENEVGIKDNLILESIAYHHESNLKNAKIADDSYAYITYYADNIAAILLHTLHSLSPLVFCVFSAISSFFPYRWLFFSDIIRLTFLYNSE